jgi:CubicO group peptidase (beta-lactamase class C family)
MHNTKLLCALLILLITGCRQAGDTVPQTKNQESIPAPVIPGNDRTRLIAQYIPIADSIIMKYAAQSNIPGLAYGIMIDGKLIHARFSGLSDIKENIPVTDHTTFRIASMTKSFTTMAILILRDQGKLSLDDPASKYIPEMAGMKYLTSDAPEITIRDLMTHRAGFPEDNPYGDRQLSDTDEELMNLIKEGPSFSNVAGIKYEYSNLGVSLLGTVIRNVTNQPYQKFIADHIFKPLGMDRTYWEYTNVPAPELAHGYRWINNGFTEEELLHDGSWGGMGGLLTTIDDFSLYMSLHLAAWPPRDVEDNGPIKRSSIREMHQMWNVDGVNAEYTYPTGRQCPTVSGYGFGLRVVKDCESRITIGHGGGLPGFGSHWLIMPDYGLGIAIFSNRTYAGWGGVNMQVLDTLIALTGIQPYHVTSSILEQRKKELLQLLPNWTDAQMSKIFAENFFPDNPVDSLRKLSKRLFEKAGTVKNITAISPMNNLRGHFDIEGENANLRVFFTLSPEHDPKIQAFHISELKQDQ